MDSAQPQPYSGPWTDEALAACPVDDHIRLRGAQMTRLETFVDAAFAFCVTMLVIAVGDLPQSFAELTDALWQIPAFLASFLQLVMFWLGHRAWSRRYGMDDAVSIWLSLALVAGVLVIVFPLRVIFGAALHTMTGGIVPATFRIGLSEVPTLFAVYGLAFGTLSLIIALLFAHARRRAEDLRLSPVERLDVRSNLGAWLILAATGFVSSLIAAFASGPVIYIVPWSYALLSIVMPLFSMHETKALKALLAADDSATVSRPDLNDS